MIIGIDGREIEDGIFTGIGQVLNNFLNFFEYLNDDNRIILFTNKKCIYKSGSRISNIVSAASPITIYWDQIVLPTLIKKYKVSFFYSPYYKVPLATSVPIISTIFDLMYIYYPVKWKGNNFFSRLYYRLIGKIMAAKARIIFTCSNYSKNEIIRSYGVTPGKVEVIQLGISEKYRRLEDRTIIDGVKRKFGIDLPYLLYCGNFKPHKNVSVLIDAFEMVRNSGFKIMLVLAGNKSGDFLSTAKRIGISSHAGAIITTGNITQEEQIALYNGAAVFVFPSLYEGFGFPPLEAMACGTAVISSDRTSLSEVVGDAALICNPLNAADIADKIIYMLQNEDVRSLYIGRGLRRAQLFVNSQFCNRFYTMLLSCSRNMRSK